MADEGRKNRSLTQRILLDDTVFHPEKHDYTFQIRGTQDTTYYIHAQPSKEKKISVDCTCPDHQRRGRRCKHIYFVLLRVLHYRESEADEAEFCLDDFALKVASMERGAYTTTAARKEEEETKPLEVVVSSWKPGVRLDTSDECGICCMEMNPVEEDIIFCKETCGKCVHSECFRRWGKRECVYCRSQMSFHKIQA